MFSNAARYGFNTNRLPLQQEQGDIGHVARRGPKCPRSDKEASDRRNTFQNLDDSTCREIAVKGEMILGRLVKSRVDSQLNVLYFQSKYLQ